METKIDVEEKMGSIDCPFSNSCILPKRESICKDPEYKVCPEYEIKKKKLLK